MKHIICEKCGWIHFAKKEQEIKEHAQMLETYVKTLSEEKKKDMGFQDFSVEKYVEQQKRCFRCGSNELRLAHEHEEPPILSTIQAIIFEN